MTITQIVLGAALTVAGLLWTVIKRGRTIADLKTDLALQPGQIAIDKLKDELNETSKDADIKSNDFNDLKRSNADLARKLGLSGRSDSDS